MSEKKFSYNLVTYEGTFKEMFRFHTDPFNVISINTETAVVLCFLNVEPVTRSQGRNFRCELRYSVTTLLGPEQQQYSQYISEK
jgi:hypothetical protein